MYSTYTEEFHDITHQPLCHKQKGVTKRAVILTDRGGIYGGIQTRYEGPGHESEEVCGNPIDIMIFKQRVLHESFGEKRDLLSYLNR
jgi:hypothetical protein